MPYTRKVIHEAEIWLANVGMIQLSKLLCWRFRIIENSDVFIYVAGLVTCPSPASDPTSRIVVHRCVRAGRQWYHTYIRCQFRRTAQFHQCYVVTTTDMVRFILRVLWNKQAICSRPGWISVAIWRNSLINKYTIVILSYNKCSTVIQVGLPQKYRQHKDAGRCWILDVMLMIQWQLSGYLYFSAYKTFNVSHWTTLLCDQFLCF